MNTLFVTIIAAIILMLLVTIALAIGLLITGKSRLRRGCGFTPGKKPRKDSEEDSSCPMCGHKDTCKKENDNDDNS